MLQLLNDFLDTNRYGNQLLHIGFASPLAFDKTLGLQMISEVPLFAGDSKLVRGDLFHHFVNREDIVPRALSVVSVASGKLAKWAEDVTILGGLALSTLPNVAGVIGGRAAKLAPLVGELVKLAVPVYGAIGHWHFLNGKEQIDRIAHVEQDFLDICQRLSIKGFKDVKRCISRTMHRNNISVKSLQTIRVHLKRNQILSWRNLVILMG